MKIEKIRFGKTIAMSGYNNDKPEVEVILEPGETLEQVLSALNKRLTDWHKAEYPHLYQEKEDFFPMAGNGQPFVKTPIENFISHPVPLPEIQTEGGNRDETKAAIYTVKTIEELKSYKLMASGDKELYSAYNQRLKELNNG